jgi:hypothetical protein
LPEKRTSSHASSASCIFCFLLLLLPTSASIRGRHATKDGEEVYLLESIDGKSKPSTHLLLLVQVVQLTHRLSSILGRKCLSNGTFFTDKQTKLRTVERTTSLPRSVRF